MSHSRKHKTNYNVTDTPTPGSTKRRRRNLNAHLNKTDVQPHSHSTSPLSPTPSTTTYAASSTDTTYPHDLLTDETQQFSNSPQKQTLAPNTTCRSKTCPSPTICQLTNVVYEATCTLCQQTYIGQTRRKLHDRIREHTYAARKHDNTSAFGEHYANTHPNTTTPNITLKILKRTSDTLRLHIEEAYAIQTKSPQLNRRDEHLGMGFLI